MKYEYFIAGRARNKEYVLKVCELLDKYNISYYCFLKESYKRYGFTNQEAPQKQDAFESIGIKDPEVYQIFSEDLEGIKSSEKFILVLPSGKSGHVEAGIAYGMGKKCYAVGEYGPTDHVYNIFEHIFSNEEELNEFLEMNKK